jgi:peptidoglycan/LPS O-acetylase OafA/YrhL
MQTPFDQRDNNFDFIRLALSLLVIFSHSFPLSTGPQSGEPFMFMTRQQVTGGTAAVDFFFIISGFLITASYERSRSIGSYVMKRVRRIYPGFLVAMLFGLFVVLPVSGGYLEGTSLFSKVGGFVIQMLRLQEFSYAHAFSSNIYPNVINGSVWTIQYEFWCYLGVVLLGLSGVLRSAKMLVGLFCFSVLMGFLFFFYGWAPKIKFLDMLFGYAPYWARLLPMYLAGVVAYRVRHHLLLKRSWIVTACVLLVAGAVIPHGWLIFFPAAGAYLVLALAFHPAVRLHTWSRFGDFSYGTYLYAFPVQQLLMRRIGHPVSPMLLFVLAAPLSVGCAVLSWHGVEKWFLGRGHKISALERGAVAGAS